MKNTDIETISAFHFVFADSLIVFASQHAVGRAISRQKVSSCIWVTIPVDRVILQWFTFGADRCAVGRTYGHVTTSHDQNFSDA